MSKTLRVILLALAIPCLLLCACNIFGWIHKDKTAEEHYAEGIRLMQEQRYQEAESEFAQVLESQPNNGDARYYHAKATLLSSGVDVVQLVEEISNPDGIQPGDGLPLYSPDEGVSMAVDIYTTNKIYRANATVREDLLWIYEGKTYGNFTPRDIEVDLTIATAVYAILGFRDTNQDGKIDSQDSLFNILATEDGYNVENIGQLLDDPEIINSLIDFTVDLIESSDCLLDSVASRLSNTLDTEDIRGYLIDAKESLEKYRYDDGQDNDGDGYVDEECLNCLDDDQDGLVDQDSKSKHLCPFDFRGED